MTDSTLQGLRLLQRAGEIGSGCLRTSPFSGSRDITGRETNRNNNREACCVSKWAD